ncbi:HNH endonuclease [Microbacterium sp. A1-JK]|uniref:HNH endonuclease n=1 Tax=Microbacterium sp. A1-JK TaxID=3177516 RepID=UPI00388A9A0B
MTVTVNDKKDVIARDGGFCLLALAHCTGEAQTADHRANRGQGGAGDVLDGGENLVAACAICNGMKEVATGRTRNDLIQRGLRVLPASTHAKTALRVRLTPVQTLDGSWWSLLGYRDRRPATVAEVDAHLSGVWV